MVSDDLGPQTFVGQAVLGQEMLVKEVPKGSMADVVQQARDAQQGLDVATAGNVWTHGLQAVVERLGGATGQEHRAEYVLKAGVLRGRKNPAGGLKLVNLTKTLKPWAVDQVLFRSLLVGFPTFRSDKGDVTVNRAVNQRGVRNLAHGTHRSLPLLGLKMPPNLRPRSRRVPAPGL